MKDIQPLGASHQAHEQPDMEPIKNWKLRFGLIFLGQAMSQVGSSLTQFILLWWIADTTGSVSSLATAGTAALLPQALLSPLGGVLADRYSRRLLMIVADAISAACIVLLIISFLSGSIQIWHAYIMMAIRGAMQAFQTPASTASMAMLVPKGFVPRAVGINQALQSFTIVASAPLGALAISLMPIGWALSIDVVTAILAIVPLFFYTIPQKKLDDGIAKTASMYTEFKEGFNLIWKNPGLRRLYALLGCVVIIIMPSYTFVPLLVKNHFGGAATQIAILEGFGGIGMVVGGLIASAIKFKRFLPWVIWGFALSCLALALTAFSPSDFFTIAVVFWVLSGAAYILGNVPLTSLLQTIIPNQLQGRALSLLNSITGLATPIGLMLTTPLGELLGIRWLFIVLGILGTIISLLGLASVKLKKLDERQPFIDRES